MAYLSVWGPYDEEGTLVFEDVDDVCDSCPPKSNFFKNEPQIGLMFFILLIMQFPIFVILHVCSVTFVMYSVEYGAPKCSEIGKALQNLCCHSNRTHFNFFIVLLTLQTA